jgi:hypothetical protein
MKKIHPIILTLVILSTLGFLATVLLQVYWNHNVRIETNLEGTFVFIDGKAMGQTPTDVRLKKGIYKLELIHPLAIKKVDSIRYTGEILHLKYNLVKGFRFVSSKNYDYNGKREKVASFYLASTELTNKEYRYFVEDKKYPEPKSFTDPNFNKDNQPVHGLSYYDAIEYTKWLSEKTGYNCRLPYEIEWEIAANKADTNNVYPWGDFERLENRFLANYHPLDHLKRTMFKKDIDGFEYTAPVKSFKRLNNPFYDIAGNVSEWCLDKKDNSKNTFHLNEKKDKTLALVKGGSWNFTHEFLKVKHRAFVDADDRNGNIGIRVLIENPNNH